MPSFRQGEIWHFPKISASVEYQSQTLLTLIHMKVPEGFLIICILKT